MGWHYRCVECNETLCAASALTMSKMDGPGLSKKEFCEMVPSRPMHSTPNLRLWMLLLIKRKPGPVILSLIPVSRESRVSSSRANSNVCGLRYSPDPSPNPSLNPSLIRRTHRVDHLCRMQRREA